MSNAKEKGEEEQTNTRQKLSFMGLMERIVILIFLLSLLYKVRCLPFLTLLDYK